MPTVRTVGTADRSGVLTLVRSAFDAPGHDPTEEVTVVTGTWASGATIPSLELVATEDDAVVGYALGARGTVGRVGGAGGGAVVTVAPLAVEPGHQGHGVGTILMAELLARADRQGWPAVVLLGDPAYYGRFGFEPAAPAGLWYGPTGHNDAHFQVRRLSAYDPGLRGRVQYCWEDAGPDRDSEGADREV